MHNEFAMSLWIVILIMLPRVLPVGLVKSPQYEVTLFHAGLQCFFKLEMMFSLLRLSNAHLQHASCSHNSMKPLQPWHNLASFVCRNIAYVSLSCSKLAMTTLQRRCRHRTLRSGCLKASLIGLITKYAHHE